MNDVVKVEQNNVVPFQDHVASILGVIERAASNPNVDVDKMRALLDMQKEVFEHKAKMEFYEAMAKVQAEVPQIVNRAENKQTSSHYAKLEHIAAELVPVATKYGFSVSFGNAPATKDRHVHTTGELMHSGGYSKQYAVELPYDATGIAGKVNKTDIHAHKSAHTYGKTILTCNMFNVTTKDDPSADDGNAAGRQTRPITQEQALNIQALIEETKSDKTKFLKYMSTQCNRQITKIEDIPETAYKVAVQSLESKRKKV